MEKKFRYYALIICVDLFLFNLVFLLALLLRFGEVHYEFPYPYLLFSGFISLAYLVSFHRLYKYKTYAVVDLLYETFRASFIASAVIAAYAYFDWTFTMHRLLIIYQFMIVFPLSFVVHLMLRPKFDLDRNLLVVGADKFSYSLLERLKGENIIGFLDDNGAKSVGSYPILGRISSIRKIIEKYRIEVVVIALSEKDNDRIFDILIQCRDTKVKFKAIPDLYDFVLSDSNVKNSLIDISIQPLSIPNRIIKRSFDVLVSSAFLIISAPLWFIIPIAIKLESKGPVFYSQKRAARFNETFSFFKFRTMVADAEKSGPKISDNDKDPRITRVGRLLRKTHLDELPQLLSILKGDMSVVGPRPERPVFNKQFKKQFSNWDKRVYVKPGLTGLAQINNITGLNPKEKIKYDLYYIKHQSVLLDTRILLRQLLKVLLRE